MGLPSRNRLRLERGTEVVGRPGPGDFDNHAGGQKIAAERFAGGVKGGDPRLGQQERSVPHHLFFSRGEALRQRAKSMPRVGDAR